MTGPGQPMYAIAGGKGGCGKTTTVCGLARALVRAGRRPIVVDADVDMPDLHDRVGAELEPGLDALGSGAELDSVLQEDHDLDGVDVVASGASSGTMSTTHRALDRLAAVTRPVLVDCPAGAGPDVATALGSAERTVVVSTDTRESLEDAAKTAAMSDALETPVACLCLRETSPAQRPTGTNPGQDPASSNTQQTATRVKHGLDATRADERLRRLVDAPTVVRIPSLRGSASGARERESPSVTRRTGAASRYDRLARVTVLRSHSSGFREPLRDNAPVR